MFVGDWIGWYRGRLRWVTIWCFWEVSDGVLQGGLELLQRRAYLLWAIAGPEGTDGMDWARAEKGSGTYKQQLVDLVILQ